MRYFHLLFFITCALDLATISVAADAAKPTEVAYKDLKWNDDVYFLDGKPFTGLARDQHKNGKPKGEYPFKEGRLHGVVREWWENGQLSTETHFEMGQRHGLNRYWMKDGQLLKEQVYDHDKSISEKHFEPK
jgi:antitoxin component YwqK of YwqJK toxin-antitoxin module